MPSAIASIFLFIHIIGLSLILSMVYAVSIPYSVLPKAIRALARVDHSVSAEHQSVAELYIRVLSSNSTIAIGKANT